MSLLGKLGLATTLVGAFALGSCDSNSQNSNKAVSQQGVEDFFGEYEIIAEVYESRDGSFRQIDEKERNKIIEIWKEYQREGSIHLSKDWFSLKLEGNGQLIAPLSSSRQSERYNEAIFEVREDYLPPTTDVIPPKEIKIRKDPEYIENYRIVITPKGHKERTDQRGMRTKTKEFLTKKIE